MTGKPSYRSDWGDWMETVEDWVHQAVRRRPRDWSGKEWRRLVDLYRISDIADASLFDYLHSALRRDKCVRSTARLTWIGDWKAPRTKPWLGKNLDRDVSRVTREAFSMVEQDPALENSIAAIKTLWNGLYGIGIPMASTLLTLYDSKHFGVIDTFGWFCLFNEEDVQITRFRQWEEYLTVIRELAGTHRLECREIDAALWYAGTTRRDFAMANQ